jgi:hypothetical protein
LIVDIDQRRHPVNEKPCIVLVGAERVNTWATATGPPVGSSACRYAWLSRRRVKSSAAFDASELGHRVGKAVVESRSAPPVTPGLKPLHKTGIGMPHRRTCYLFLRTGLM